jgi:two-component system, LytTR family, sensor kinase
MNKKLYRAAFISSPIISVVGSVPLVILEQISSSKVFVLWGFLAITILVFWFINIFILSKVKDPYSVKRYVLSFVIVLLIQLVNIFLASRFGIKSTETKGLIYPLIPAIGINSLILLISNSIILQFEKRNAQLEIQELKVTNLEAQRLILLQQLQPHFLFNALSTLKSLICDDPKSAEDYTVQLSDFLRYSIQAKNTEIVSLEDELAFTQNYIGLQKVRFGDSIKYNMDISKDFLDKKLPVYALQTLVENAIKHNAFTDRKPLTIEVEMEGNRLKISNTLTPKTTQLVSGTGLDNLNQRYKLIAEKQIEILETETHYTVFIPLL